MQRGPDLQTEELRVGRFQVTNTSRSLLSPAGRSNPDHCHRRGDGLHSKGPLTFLFCPLVPPLLPDAGFLRRLIFTVSVLLPDFHWHRGKGTGSMHEWSVDQLFPLCVCVCA